MAAVREEHGVTMQAPGCSKARPVATVKEPALVCIEAGQLVVEQLAVAKAQGVC